MWPYFSSINSGEAALAGSRLFLESRAAWAWAWACWAIWAAWGDPARGRKGLKPGVRSLWW